MKEDCEAFPIPRLSSVKMGVKPSNPPSLSKQVIQDYCTSFLFISFARSSFRFLRSVFLPGNLIEIRRFHFHRVCSMRTRETCC